MGGSGAASNGSSWATVQRPQQRSHTAMGGFNSATMKRHLPELNELQQWAHSAYSLKMSPFEPCGSGAAKASLTGVLMKAVKQERLLSSLKSSSSLPRVSVVL